MLKYKLFWLELLIKFKKTHSEDPKINIKLNIENINNIELKKLAQYWKKIMFKYDFGNSLEKLLFFKLLLNQLLETENLYNIIKDVNSSKNKKV